MSKLDAMRQCFKSELEPLEKLVFLAILDHCDPDGRSWPSLTRLAQWTGLDRRTVTRTLAALRTKASGLLRIESGSRTEPNHYQVQWGPAAPSVSPPLGAHDPKGRGTRSPEVGAQRPSKQDIEAGHEAGQLHLVSPAARRPKPRKQKPADPTGHQRVIDAYHVAFERRRGSKPPFTSKDAAAAKRLREAVGVDAACQVIEAAFAHEFWGKDASIQSIAANPARFTSIQARASPRLAVQGGPQPDFSKQLNNRFVSGD